VIRKALANPLKSEICVSDFGRTVIRLCKGDGGLLTLRQLGVLFYCGEADLMIDRQVKAIAGYFGWGKPVISRIGDALEGGGYVTRDHLPGDRRSLAFTLTKLGHKMLISLENPTPAPRAKAQKNGKASAQTGA